MEGTLETPMKLNARVFKSQKPFGLADGGDSSLRFLKSKGSVARSQKPFGLVDGGD